MYEPSTNASMGTVSVRARVRVCVAAVCMLRMLVAVVGNNRDVHINIRK